MFLNSVGLEALNGAWAMLGVLMLAVLAHKFCQQVCWAFDLHRATALAELRLSKKAACWYAVRQIVRGNFRLRVKAIIALMVYFAGETSVNAWRWLWRRQLNDGVDVTWMKDIPIPAIGMVIAIAGGLMTLYVLSEQEWGPRVWLMLGLFAIAAAALLAIP